MAKIEGLVRHILKWECGASERQMRACLSDESLFNVVKKVVNDPRDPGGFTNSGITIDTWKRLGYDKDKDGDIDVADLRAIDYADWLMILKKGYWGKALADKIESQSVANMIVDWMYTSGGAAKEIQKAVGVTADGIFGKKTLSAINAIPPYQLWVRIKQLRLSYYKKNKNWNIYGRGWSNRVNDLKFMG